VFGVTRKPFLPKGVEFGVRGQVPAQLGTDLPGLVSGIPDERPTEKVVRDEIL
jgi:hypothetical protein